MFGSIFRLSRVLAGILLATFLMAVTLLSEQALAVDKVTYLGQVLEVTKDQAVIQVIAPSCKGKRSFNVAPGNSLTQGETIRFTLENKEGGDPCSGGTLILLSPVGR